jgi:hypothetical protein
LLYTKSAQIAACVTAATGRRHSERHPVRQRAAEEKPNKRNHRNGVVKVNIRIGGDEMAGRESL